MELRVILLVSFPNNYQLRRAPFASTKQNPWCVLSEPARFWGRETTQQRLPGGVSRPGRRGGRRRQRRRQQRRGFRPGMSETGSQKRGLDLVISPPKGSESPGWFFGFLFFLTTDRVRPKIAKVHPEVSCCGCTESGRTTLKPWLKPLLVGIYRGMNHRSKGFLGAGLRPAKWQTNIPRFMQGNLWFIPKPFTFP